MKRAIKRGVGVKVLVGVGLLAGAPAIMASTVNIKAQHQESRVKIVNLRLAELSTRSPHPETRVVEPVVKPRPHVSNPPPPMGAPTPPVGGPPPPAPPAPSPPPPAPHAPPPPPAPPPVVPPPVVPPPPPYMPPPPPITRAQSAPEINAASAASGLTLLLGGLLVLGARRKGA